MLPLIPLRPYMYTRIKLPIISRRNNIVIANDASFLISEHDSEYENRSEITDEEIPVIIPVRGDQFADLTSRYMESIMVSSDNLVLSRQAKKMTPNLET